MGDLRAGRIVWDSRDVVPVDLAAFEAERTAYLERSRAARKRERVLASHTSDVRASEFELAVEIAASPSKSTRALTTP